MDVVAEHQLTDIGRYPLLIYPEWDSITPVFKEKLLNYVSQGGKLLLIGPKSAALFEKELNVSLKGKPELKTNALEFNHWLADVQSVSQSALPGQGVRSIGRYFLSWDMETPSEVAATITKFGKGEIGAVYMNLGEVSSGRFAPVMRDFLNSVVRELFPEPAVEVTGSHYVDVTLNKVKDKLVVNLVNTAGPHNNSKVLVYDEIPVVGPLNISVKYPAKPHKVMLQPENKPLIYKYEQGKIRCKVDELNIHDMIVIE